MARASFMQTSFLGGEWSKFVQGRMDSEKYKISLNLCQNYYPLEEGALMRRQGTRYIAHTRGGTAGRVIPLSFRENSSFQMAHTDGYLRFVAGQSLVFENETIVISDISTANPAVVTASTTLPSNWVTGKTIMFAFDNSHGCPAPYLFNRQFVITKLSGTTFSIADALTGTDIDGAVAAYTYVGPGDDAAYLVHELTTPYTDGEWETIRAVHDETSAILLQGDFIPQVVTETAVGSGLFQIADADLLDGPYLDENTETTTLTPSGTSGSITITASSVVGINEDTGFQSTDVGRLVRLRSSPSAWSSGSTYAVGDLVTGTDDNIYTSLIASNTAHDPTSDVVNWSVAPSGHVWNWGEITAVGSTTSATLLLRGATALINANATTHWRLGVFSDTTGWPTCGSYHEGRLWLSGVIGNRVDGSKSNDPYNFSPTSVDGTVADNNAVSATAKSTDVNDIFWMQSKEDGLYFGTQASEWRIRASGYDDPITPFTIQFRRVSNYGSYNAEPIAAPVASAFIQARRRKVLEMIPSGDSAEIENLSLTAGHLTSNYLAEIVWQQEPMSTIWARTDAGELLGCVYKRDASTFVAGWHKTYLGGTGARDIKSISVGPSENGTSDVLYMVTANAGGIHYIEALTELFDDGKEDWEAWFLDGGTNVSHGEIVTVSGTDYLRLYGLWPYEGKEITVVLGGLDCGDYTVANGFVDVEFTTEFTTDFLDTLNASDDFGDLGIVIL